ncbi:Probable 3-phenylpropionic acid transporter [Serratia marcescens]|uniref:Probable 3-phenylpropionic acid transporter n=3 Tax=Bacteria TaxID=2 RepID=A0A379YT60_SERMA|nr:Probable 3-phenylpropionic acid transporter [Serratia marcescens]
MVLQSTRWLALSYFTYFFSYGIFLPFWGVWLKGEGIAPETIGILLGAGLVARFLGSLLIAPRVKDPSHLVSALRLLALLTLAFAVGFCFGNGWGWLMLVIAGFNLFFSPLVPLTDALAATWQKQIRMDYGRVRLWGSLAFVIGSALTGQLVAVWGHNAILYSLIFSVLAMLLGMLLKPSVMPQGEARTHGGAERSLWALLKEGPVWRFLLCVTLLQGAHAGYYSFGSIYWQEAGYSASTIGYLWSLGVVAEVIIFASSNVLFRRWNARNLLLLSACCGRAALEPDGLQHRAGLAAADPDPALRHLHRLPSGGDALYRRASGARGDPAAGGVFGAGDGRRHRRYDGHCRVPVRTLAGRGILGDGGGRGAGLVHPAAGGQRQPLIKALPAARGWPGAAGFPAAVRYRSAAGAARCAPPHKE